MSWLLPSVMALVAAGGYSQVAGQDIFWCGRTEAFPGTAILAVLCLAHTALYLAAAARVRWQGWYRLSQMLTVPVLIVAILPVLLPHPRTLIFLTLLAAATAWFGLRRGGVFAVTLLGLLAAIGQIPFSFHGVIVRDWMAWGALAAAALAAMRLPTLQHHEPDGENVFAGSGDPASPVVVGLAVLPPTDRYPDNSGDMPGHDGHDMRCAARDFLSTASRPAPGEGSGNPLPDAEARVTRTRPATTSHGARPAHRLEIPLTLLLFPLLRARLPDIAYDSLSYKATIPYQMAEWRTGDSAIIDGYMIGTNLQEMLNALLRILTGDWRPQLITSLSFVLLALIIPAAFPADRHPPGARRAALAFAGVAAFVLTEAGIAQGTAYQEPLLLLFLVAALIRCPLWPGFLAMAAAVKITALFIAPLILLYHALQYPGFWRSPRFLLIGALTAVLALAPQLERNVVLSGRLLGMSEILAGVTDPPGPHQVMASGIARYDRQPRGSLLNNAVQSACNIWLLNGLCSVRYKGNFESGFGVFPASRAALFAVIFALAACVRRRSLTAFLALAAFGIGYAGLLTIVSEGRYFLPLSLGFAIFLLIDLPLAARFARRPWALPLACWLIGADLLPGTFTNASWICRRDITAAVDNPSLQGPQTAVQAFLATRTAQYKKTCAPPGLPPVILAETDRMNSPYLGTQRIFHVFTQTMIRGFLDADPTRRTRLGNAVLAIVEDHPSYATSLLGPAGGDFQTCYQADGFHVLCSTRLAPAGPACAQSLY